MQETDDGSNEDATRAGARETTRILAHSDNVAVQRSGRVIAKLIYVEEVGELEQKDGVTWRRLRFRELHWPAPASLIILMGLERYAIYPPYLITYACRRPPYAPQPGMDDVHVAEILGNEDDLDQLELFSVVMQK